jgi:hypothetical protein
LKTLGDFEFRKTLNTKMKIPEKPIFLIFVSLILASSLTFTATAKSTIEPCSSNDTCNALLGYTLYTDLKVSEVASLFQVDPISILLANAIDISYPDVENHILPSKLFLKIPITCSCVDGIRKSVSTHYKTRPSDNLGSIADSVYGGLVSAEQIQEANSVNDPSLLDVGTSLVIPLPCACFNGTDNSLPAVYLSYVVTPLTFKTNASFLVPWSEAFTDERIINSHLELKKCKRQPTKNDSSLLLSSPLRIQRLENPAAAKWLRLCILHSLYPLLKQSISLRSLTVPNILSSGRNTDQPNQPNLSSR